MATTVLIWGALVPIAVAAGVLLIALRPWTALETIDRAERGRWAPPVAIGAAYIAGHWGMASGPFGSTDIARWLIVLAAIGMVLGVVEALRPLPLSLSWALRIGLALLAAGLLLRPLIAQGWTPMQTASMLVAAVLAISLAWWALDSLATAEPGPSLLFGLLLIAGGGSATLVLSATASVGQLAGVLVAALGAVFLVSWKFPSAGWLRGMAPPVALILVGHWLIGMHYANLPRASFLALALAPLALFAVRWPPLARAGNIALFAARVVVVFALVATAAGVAAKSYFGAGEPASGSPSKAASDDYGY